MIPFYIFSQESRLEEYNKDEEKLVSLKREYADIMKRLNVMQENQEISVYTRKTILEMAEKVLENIAGKYNNVREGVKSIMGGRVLEYEAKTILQEGRREGRIEQAKETARNLLSYGLEEKAIAEMVNVDISLIKEWFAQDSEPGK